MTWYSATGAPGTKSFQASATIRAEFDLISQSFQQMPTLTGNQNQFVVVNATGTGMSTIEGADARQALGLQIGTDVQAYSPSLQGTTASFTTELNTQYNNLVAYFAIDHKDDTGKHTKVTLPVSDADRSASFGELVVYSKYFNGRPELFIRGPGLEPLRLTQNGELFADWTQTNGEFASLRTLSYLRGTVTDLGDVSGTVEVNWESGTIFRMNITGDLMISLTGMPSSEDEEDQTMYFDVTMDGTHSVGVSSTYDLVFPGGPNGNTGFTEDGRDLVICNTNDGSSILVMYINNLAAGS